MSYLNSPTKQTGAATLIITVIVLVAAIASMIFATNYSSLQQKTVASQYINSQSYEAAEAGLEFGLQYLTQNSAAIIATASAGVLSYGATDTNLTNVALSNSAKFSVVYTNPTTSNYQLILITSTGVSPDATATTVIRQLAQVAASSGSYTATAVGNVTLVGGSVLRNYTANNNVSTGGTLTINNGASTTTSTSGSTQGNYGTDVQQNVSSLTGDAESSFFTSLFGSSEATVKAAAQASGNYYTNTPGNDYSAIMALKSGVTVWIDQTNGSAATLGHGAVIGTALNPVVLIVEGDLTIANGVTLNGFVYSSAPSAGFNFAGGGTINGGVASAGALNLSNGAVVNYTAYANLPLPTGSKTYAFVPGSWRDF